MYLAARQWVQSKRSQQLPCTECVMPPSLSGTTHSTLLSVAYPRSDLLCVLSAAVVIHSTPTLTTRIALFGLQVLCWMTNILVVRLLKKSYVGC